MFVLGSEVEGHCLVSDVIGHALVHWSLRVKRLTEIRFDTVHSGRFSTSVYCLYSRSTISVFRFTCYFQKKLKLILILFFKLLNKKEHFL